MAGIYLVIYQCKSSCHFISSTDSFSMHAFCLVLLIDCSVKATIERYKKAHAVGSSSGPPLLELNAQVTVY
jgi:hypothetical protein